MEKNELMVPYGTKYINNKTGNFYYYQGTIINATNSNDGQVMVLYKNEYGELFCRELNEFKEKFTIDFGQEYF